MEETPARAPMNEPAQNAVRRVGRKKGFAVSAIPCKDATGRHPGHLRRRVLRIGKKIVGIHYLQNVHRRKNRNVQYARVQVYRSSVLSQDEKFFYIAPPNHPARIVIKSPNSLLKLFARSKKTVTMYFAL